MFDLVAINFILNTKKFKNLGHINLGLAINLNFPNAKSSKLWPQDVLTDCSFPITQRNQSATQRALGYVYTRFWDIIKSLKNFAVCNPDSQINFLFLLHTVKVQFLFALAHQKYTPSPIRACTISVHSNFSFLCSLIEGGAEGNFAILKIYKNSSFHSVFFSFYQRKIKVLQSILNEHLLSLH